MPPRKKKKKKIADDPDATEEEPPANDDPDATEEEAAPRKRLKTSEEGGGAAAHPKRKRAEDDPDATEEEEEESKKRRKSGDGDDEPPKKKPRAAPRQFVARAHAAESIEKLAPTSAAIVRLRLDPDDPDAKVPEPKDIPAGRALIAYSYHIYYRGKPPHPQFDRFDRYEDWLRALIYRSPEWTAEHGKFGSASFIGKMLGIDPSCSPEKAWYECKFPKQERETNEFSLKITERGVQLETFHEQLLQITDASHEYVCGCPSQLHPKLKYIMATPDAKVYERKKDGGRGKHVRDCEFKSPSSRGAFYVVQPEHMSQMQTTMEVDDVGECDYSSLQIEDETGRSEWIVIRVKRSKKYWEAALPVIKEFIRAVLTGAVPPPRKTFSPPRVKVFTIIRGNDVLESIPNWQTKLSNALISANAKAMEAAARNREINVFVARQKAEAEANAERALNKSFDEPL